MKQKVQRPILLCEKEPKDICDEIDVLVSTGNHIDNITELARIDIGGKTRNTVLILVSIEVDKEVDKEEEQPKKQTDGKREIVSGNGS